MKDSYSVLKKVKKLRRYASHQTRKHDINQLTFNRLNENNMSENLQLKVVKEKQASHKNLLPVMHK